LRKSGKQPSGMSLGPMLPDDLLARRVFLEDLAAR
jgi:hypothetical protein